MAQGVRKDSNISLGEQIDKGGQMTLRCRKGDMAWDLHGGTKYYGRVCDVGEFLGDIKLEDGTIGKDVWRVSYSGETHNLATGLPWVEQDKFLLPIRPGDLDESTETDKTLEFAE
jgi:hypothetical protein